jgi:hypothetical protein
MKTPETQANEQRRVDEPRGPAETQNADAAPKAPGRTHFVDPYDMRADPQPEEPGYGHGV